MIEKACEDSRRNPGVTIYTALPVPVSMPPCCWQRDGQSCDEIATWRLYELLDGKIQDSAATFCDSHVYEATRWTTLEFGEHPYAVWHPELPTPIGDAVPGAVVNGRPYESD